MSDHSEKIGQELAGFSALEHVHDLPPIYDYWVGRYLQALLRDVGLTSLQDWWDAEVAELCAARAPHSVRLVSLGAGNGDLEIEMGARLAGRGIDNLEIELLELNPTMLERAEAHAERAGLTDRVTGVLADLNTWRASHEADVYLACHSLHHVVELEHLYDQVAATLADDGVLLVNDMVGRNGHRRWPEALRLVQEVWRVALPRHRINVLTGVEDVAYPDLDCSTEGFEGVRAQDVLPLLLQRLHPQVYVTFGNVIDPFFDRVYGPNLDPRDAADRRFIDAVATLDEAAIDLGLLTPTHLLGTFRKYPVACRYPRDRSPQRTVRDPNAPPLDAPPAGAHEAELEQLRQAAHEAHSRYLALRTRKVVRLGLGLGRLTARARTLAEATTARRRSSSSASGTRRRR